MPHDHIPTSTLAVECGLGVTPGSLASRAIVSGSCRGSARAVGQERGEPVGELSDRRHRGQAVDVAGGVAAGWCDR